MMLVTKNRCTKKSKKFTEGKRFLLRILLAILDLKTKYSSEKTRIVWFKRSTKRIEKWSKFWSKM